MDSYINPYQTGIPPKVSKPEGEISILVIGHGVLAKQNIIFKPGPYCIVHYIGAFGNSVIASSEEDKNAYYGLGLSGFNPEKTVDDDYETVISAYNQHNEAHEESQNTYRIKTTQSIACIDKKFTFIEHLRLSSQDKAINNHNYGVYIMRNDYGIFPGYKLDITSLPNYPNVLFSEIIDMLVTKIGLNEDSTIRVYDPTCNDLTGKTERAKRQIVRDFESIVNYINEVDDDEIKYGRIKRLIRGGSKKRRNRGKQKTKKNKT